MDYCRHINRPTVHVIQQTAIASVFNDIVRAVDAGQVWAPVLLDLSAAFDTVDHGILSEVLEKRFAIDGVLEWFRSYLSGRTQTYRVANASVPVELTCSVPQGSIFGPSQFTAYTEDIQDVIMLDYHLYADDTQLIAKSTICSIDVTCRRLERPSTR